MSKAIKLAEDLLRVLEEEAAESATPRMTALLKSKDAMIAYQADQLRIVRANRLVDARENEQLRAKVTILVTSADYWRNTALAQAGAMERIAERDAVIVELLRKHIARLQAKADGWIEWAGGECPIKDGRTVVKARLRCGERIAATPAEFLRWGHGTGDEWMDIVAYRIVTVPHE